MSTGDDDAELGDDVYRRLEWLIEDLLVDNAGLGAARRECEGLLKELRWTDFTAAEVLGMLGVLRRVDSRRTTPTPPPPPRGTPKPQPAPRRRMELVRTA